MLFEILGLKEPAQETGSGKDRTASLVALILKLRQEAREHKDFASSDRLRDELISLGVTLRDTKEGTDWEIR